MISGANVVKGPIDGGPKNVTWFAALAGPILVGTIAGWRYFDHCPGISCDFRFYYDEVQHLFPPDFQVVPGWLYPPAAALFFLPFRPLPFTAAAGIWTVINLALLVVFAGQCAQCFPHRQDKERRMLGAGLVLMSLPVFHALKWGQPSLLVVVALIAALRSERGGALLLAGAAAIKLYPVAYGLLWIGQRKVRQLVKSLALFLTFSFALPLIVLGPSPTRVLFGNVLRQGSIGPEGPWALGQTTAYWGGQGMATTLTRWFGNGEHTGTSWASGPLLFHLPSVAIRGLAVALSVLLLGTTFLRLHRRPPSRDIAIARVLTSVTLVLHPAWHHYFAFLPFASAALLGSPSLPIRPKTLTYASVAITALPLLCLPWFHDAYFLYSQAGGTTIAAAMTLVALVESSDE